MKLRPLRRQAEIAEIAAKAAKQSAEVSERSATFAQQALKTCERADILLESAGIQYPPNNDPGDASLVLKFKNFGRTRAKEVSFKASMIIPDTPSSSSPALPLPIITMASGQEQFVRFQTFREFLTKPTFEKIRKGDLPLRFESWIVYRDAFGDAFTTRDVGILDPRTFTFNFKNKCRIARGNREKSENVDENKGTVRKCNHPVVPSLSKEGSFATPPPRMRRGGAVRLCVLGVLCDLA